MHQTFKHFFTLLIVTFSSSTYLFAQSDPLTIAQEYFGALQYEQAVDAFEKAYAVNGQSEALIGMIQSHWEMGMRYQLNDQMTASQQQYNRGLQLAQQLVASDASNVEYRLLRGLLYLYNGRTDQARVDYEYARINDPNNGRAYYYLWTLEPLQGMAKINHPYATQALQLDPTLYELHQELGAYYSGLGMTEQAIEQYNLALGIEPKSYKAHLSLGQVYWNLGDLDRMRTHFEQSLVYFPDFGYAQMLLAGVELMSNQTTTAVSLIKQALKTNPKMEMYLSMYKENYPILNNYNFKYKTHANEKPIDANGYPRYYQEAITYAQEKRYVEALNLLHQCHDSYQNYAQNQPAWSMSILSWMSFCYRELGYSANAIQMSKEALALSKTYNITTDQASLAANIGTIYYGWGDYPNAINYANESLNYLQQYKQSEQLYDAYTNLGVYYRKWGKTDSAVYYHQLALKLSHKQEKYNQALAYKELALSYSTNDEMKKAQQNIDSMFGIYNQLDSQGYDPAIYMGAVLVYYKLGEYRKANEAILKVADHFLTIQQESPMHPTLIEFAATYTGISANLNEIQLAHTNLESLNYTLIQQIKYNFPVMSEQGKLIFYRDASEYFERFNSFSLTHTQVNQVVLNHMLENQLLKRGLLFNDASRFNQMMAQTDNHEANQLYEKLIAHKNLMARSITLNATDLAERDINTTHLQQQIDSLQVAINQLGIASQQTKTYEEGLVKRIQSQLEPNEAAIEMIRLRSYDFRLGGHFTDQVYYVALIQKGNSKDIEYVVLDNGQYMEGNAYTAYTNSIVHEITDTKSYMTYWQPIQQKLQGIDKVYFAGDGVYHKLNLNTLYHTETEQYVIDELDLRLITSTRDILKKTPKLPRSGNVFLVGYPTYDTSTADNQSTNTESEFITTRAFTTLNYLTPLPGTLTEVKAIENILDKSKWSTTVHTGPEANEANIKSVSSPTILHIATHGYFEESQKYDNALLYSGLFLTGAVTNFKNKNHVGEDGILTAYEAMHLDLQKTHMVVLSACETGMGRIENGEGVYGLQRAFLIAGARAVVMSMWSVNDQTTMELMSNFYRLLEDAKDKHTAFRQAQLDLKSQYANPKYWGAFNTVGK
ncbi:hypothetical protein BFP72_07370 [Reichenbachiella sp. 5M10]|uniref:CHAT domain-containing protein n=1 Tax=Reichenbachiella sp. 5M10 TaxID=1889772 RepID=UPI000C16066A|nr:CHAT domain-containing protein [Reichenbachiella sp. 5M10]PIB35228.1 hypothetical protein BFP72_07370 [Reichenbachiella sp. 5M10]